MVELCQNLETASSSTSPSPSVPSSSSACQFDFSHAVSSLSFQGLGRDSRGHHFGDASKLPFLMMVYG